MSRFARVHGGWVCARDREGGGASFRVFLPDGAVGSAAAHGAAPGTSAI